MHFFSRNVHWLTRIVLAATFLFHGLAKFPIADFASKVGLSIPMTYAVAVGEIAIVICIFFGGLGLSWMTRLAGLGMVVVMLGAITLVKWQGSWMSIEFDALILALGLFFLIRGNLGCNHHS